MKVLFLMNHEDNGGAALAFIELIENLKKMYDIEAIVYTGKKNSINARCSEQGIVNGSLPFRNFISSLHNPVWFWRLFFKIRNYLGNKVAIYLISKKVDLENIDLIYTNLDRIDFGAILAQKYQIPHIWHIREHLDTDFKVISVHKDYTGYMRKYESCFIAISESVKKTWIKRGFSSEDISVIYDGVNIDTISTKKKWYLHDKVNFVFVGGYCEEKGQFLFLKHLRKLPKEYKDKITLTFFGSGYGKYKDKLNELAEKTGMAEAISFNLYVDNLYEQLRNYDVGINFSVEEGFGRVTIEYMAAGLCTLVSESGANVELVKNMQEGILVKRDDVLEFCDAIRYIVDHRDIVKKMGKNAQEKSIIFSMERHVEKMMNIFCEEKNNF